MENECSVKTPQKVIYSNRARLIFDFKMKVG